MSEQSNIAKECKLDSDAGDRARALHRVVRAMHDGHCPNCGFIAGSEAFLVNTLMGYECPRCQFRVDFQEAYEALLEFQPYFAKSVKVFNEWRQSRQLNAVYSDTFISEPAIRKAIEPVAFWFDSDGEGEDLSVVEIVAEISRMLAEERQSLLQAKQCFDAIIEECQSNAPQAMQVILLLANKGKDITRGLLGVYKKESESET